MTSQEDMESPVRIPPLGLEAVLACPSGARGLVVFAHGSGSGRFSPRNRYVAAGLRQAACATLLLDLLLPDEEYDRSKVFDIPLLAERLEDAVRWAAGEPRLASLPAGFFGASTGAGAALLAASRMPQIAAVVSRGGRPDLAGAALSQVRSPTLLIVGGLDSAVIELNRQALERLPGEKALRIVPGATHLFEEAGTLEQVLALSAEWFRGHFVPQP
jgi:putative phosphoribosyl transferase